MMEMYGPGRWDLVNKLFNGGREVCTNCNLFPTCPKWFDGGHWFEESLSLLIWTRLTARRGPPYGVESRVASSTAHHCFVSVVISGTFLCISNAYHCRIKFGLFWGIIFWWQPHTLVHRKLEKKYFEEANDCKIPQWAFHHLLLGVFMCMCAINSHTCCSLQWTLSHTHS